VDTCYAIGCDVRKGQYKGSAPWEALWLSGMVRVKDKRNNVSFSVHQIAVWKSNGFSAVVLDRPLADLCEIISGAKKPGFARWTE
jgi:hypothetical protein